MTTLEKLLFWKAAGGGSPLYERTIINNPASFTTEVAKPLKGLSIPFLPIQAGTGDPSPSNVRPITGWTGVNINRSGEDTSDPLTIPVVFQAQGKNLLNPHMFDDRPSYYTAESNGTITVRSTDYSPWTSIEFTAMKAGTYTISYTADSGEASLRTENNYDKMLHVTQGNPVTFTVTEGEGIKIKVGVGASSYPFTASVQIEAGSTATAFEPFTNTSYGGTLDALTGVLTVSWISKTFNGGESESWGIQATHLVLWGQTPSKSNNDTTQLANWLIGGGNSYADDGKFRVQTNGALCVGNKNGNWASVDAFKAYLAQNNLQVCYEIAEPYTVQLDPVTLSTLIGDNVLWTDTNSDNTIVYLSKTQGGGLGGGFGGGFGSGSDDPGDPENPDDPIEPDNPENPEEPVIDE